MQLTWDEISKTKQDALESPRAEDLCYQGFKVGEIERAICVSCGFIDSGLLQPFSSGAAVTNSGRYVIRSGRRNHDAGHLCAECMKPKEQSG